MEGRAGGNTGLGNLGEHGFAFDGSDFFVGSFLFGGGEGVDVFEDVDGFVDPESVAHLAEPMMGLAGSEWTEWMRMRMGS